MFEQTNGIVYVRIPGHDKREPIEVDVYQPLDDVRDALKRFTPFQFDGNFRLKDSHDVLDASKSLRDLGLDCGVGQYLELDYHHPNYFPGLRGGVSKRTMASAIAASGIDRPPGKLENMSRDVLEPLYQLAQTELAKAEARRAGQGLGQTSSHHFPGARAMASAIIGSGIDRPPGTERELERMDRAPVLEPLYLKAQAELAKDRARTRREATTEQPEEKEDVEMKDVTHIKLATKEGEVLLKEEVEKLLVEADKAWTCAKIKFHDAFVDLHAIDATSACSMAWWCRFLAVLET